MGSLAKHLKFLEAAITSQDGEQVAELLVPNLNGGQDIVLADLGRELYRFKNLSKPLNQMKNLSESWNIVIQSHFKRCCVFNNHQYGSSGPLYPSKNLARCEATINLLSNFLNLAQNEDSWILPILYRLLSTLYTEATSEDVPVSILEGGARLMNKSFSCCITDRLNEDEKSRKLGIYKIVGILFKTYFKLSQTNLCSMVLRSINASQIPPLETFSLSDQATFKYYLGILSFFEENYSLAASYLSFSFLACRKLNNNPNALRCLIYLVPSNLLSSCILPSNKLLQEYPVIKEKYGDLIISIKSGNIKIFDKYLQDNLNILIKDGVYFSIEICKSLVFRRLVKKIWIVLDKSSRLDCNILNELIQSSMNRKCNIDETHCILSNLIDKGYMKGYISYEKQILVLSKVNPFPPL